MTTPRIDIDIPTQRLALLDARGAQVARYAISSAANGVGEVMDSFCTPRGRHIIRAKIGRGAPRGSVFVARRWSGERFGPGSRAAHPKRDWILTRILWLSGCEVGFNRLGRVDSMRRFIYIHGAPDDVPMGQPGSRGCIRMTCRDVIDLFDRVAPGTPVHIHE
ncbi:MAG: L,D-transpeptidase family protein [bacterium]